MADTNPVRLFIKQNYGIIILFCAGVAVRLYNLGAKSFWFDESLVLLEAKQSIPVLLGSRAEGIHPPLYRFIMHFWMMLGNGEAFLRLPSVFFSAAGIPVCFAIARRMFDKSVAAYAVAALMAFSPFQVFYAQEIKMYSLFLLLSLLSAYFFLSMMSRNRKSDSVGYVCSTALALYTHYFAVWVIIVENIVFLLCRRSVIPEIRKRWWIAQFAILLLFIPWIPAFLIHSARVGYSFWAPPVMGSDVLAGFGNFVMGYFTANMKPEISAVLFLVFFLAGALMMVRKIKETGIKTSQGQALLLCCAMVMVPAVCVWIFSIIIKPLYLERSLIFATGFYYCLLVAGGMVLKKYRVFLIMAVISFSGYLMAGLYNSYRGIHFYPAAGVVEKKPVKQVLAYILAHYKVDEPIILAHCSLVYPVKYYAPAFVQRNIYLVDNVSDSPGDRSTLHGMEKTFGILPRDIRKISLTSGGLWVICSAWDRAIIPVSRSAREWLDTQELIFKKTDFPGVEIFYYMIPAKNFMIDSGREKE